MTVKRRILVLLAGTALATVAPMGAAVAGTDHPPRTFPNEAPSANGGDNGYGNCGHNSSGGNPHSGPDGGGNGGQNGQCGSTTPPPPPPPPAY